MVQQTEQLTTHDAELEFQNLSDDRRIAIDLFVKGFVIASGFFAFGIKLLIDSDNLYESILLGIVGILLTIIGCNTWKSCVRHDSELNKRLNELCKMLGFSPIISTNYIFNTVLAISIIIMVSR